jgi:hypothetical protein
MNKKEKNQKKSKVFKTVSLIFLGFLVGVLAFYGFSGIGDQAGRVAGEQTGDSPDSGSTSRIQETYDELVSRGYGDDTAGSWGDWGVYWNRIRSAIDNTVNIDFNNQSYEEYDDYEYSDAHGAGESGNEESTWENTASNVWFDNRTGLYWSASQGQMPNLFPDQDHSACPFFSETPRGSSYDGSDADCGNAINACAVLSLESKTGEGADTDWYLPTQKELQQAYLDGIYNQAGHAFTTTSNFWSSTERSVNSSYAWGVYLCYGNAYHYYKSNSYDVRCVRRD